MGVFSTDDMKFKTVGGRNYIQFVSLKNVKVMVTVTIEIKPYLARYMYVRYGQCVEFIEATNKPLPIHLSHITPVYQTMYELTIPHPKNATWKEQGNITFVLPHPRIGKNPKSYSYIGANSAHIIEKEIETEMRMELFEYLLENKFRKGVMYKLSMERFVEHYNMVELVEEGSLMKAFQRWRKKVKAERKELEQF